MRIRQKIWKNEELKNANFGELYFALISSTLLPSLKVFETTSVQDKDRKMDWQGPHKCSMDRGLV